MAETDSFPEIIQTQRLLLRPYDRSDIHRIFSLVAGNREHLIQNFGPIVQQVVSPEKAAEFIQDRSAQWDGKKTFCYGLRLKNSEELIGQLQVKNIAWSVPSAELSYFIAKSAQRLGYASEAILAILSVAFKRLQFQRVFLRIIPSNQGSIALAKKLGFQYEGCHRKEFRCGVGDLHDVNYFSLTMEDFRAHCESRESKVSDVEH